VVKMVSHIYLVIIQGGGILSRGGRRE
jgi:hypothetical protein